jgi:hypothetical protein
MYIPITQRKKILTERCCELVWRWGGEEGEDGGPSETLAKKCGFFQYDQYYCIFHLLAST